MLRFTGNVAELPPCDFEQPEGKTFDAAVMAVDANGGTSLLVPEGATVDPAYFDAVSAGLEVATEEKAARAPKGNKSKTPPENK